MSDGVEISSEEQERIDKELCSDCPLNNGCDENGECIPEYELVDIITLECSKRNEYEMMLTNSEPE